MEPAWDRGTTAIFQELYAKRRHVERHLAGHEYLPTSVFANNGGAMDLRDALIAYRWTSPGKNSTSAVQPKHGDESNYATAAEYLMVAVKLGFARPPRRKGEDNGGSREPEDDALILEARYGRKAA